MTTQIICLSRAFQVAIAATAIRTGQLGDPERRIWLLADTTEAPEAAAPLAQAPGVAELTAGDEVLSWNELIWPLHPSDWEPRPEDLPLWERHLSRELGLSGPVELVLESIQVPPARSVAAIVAQASITVLGEGLMSYGPTRVRLPGEVGLRIDRLLHLDLVPEVTPQLLREFDVPADIIPAAELLPTLDLLPAAPPAPTDRPAALLLGQFLSQLGILSVADETELHVAMVESARAAGHDVVILKPHPAAPAGFTDAVLDRAQRLGVTAHVAPAQVLAERLYGAWPITEVFGCFSTGLFTARACFGLPARSVGAAQLAAGLKPYANSNRVPVVLTDLLLGAEHGVDRDPQAVLEVLAYTMQPGLRPEFHDHAAAYLAQFGDRDRAWFPVGRLGELGLPGGRRSLAARAKPLLRRTARDLYALERRVEERLRGAVQD